MSDHITMTLEFRLARETPRPLIDALRARAAGETPKADDLSQLPHSVAEYLRIEGADVRIDTLGPLDGTLRFLYSRKFHDDEYYNFGMYHIFYFFQFASGQGHLATETLEFDTPPTIYTKIGEDIVVTRLSYNPETYQALDHRDTPLDPERPIVVADTSRSNLAQMLDGLDFMNQDEN